ncbi:MAG: hypothetical protein ACI8QZ_002181 [Chlamydiales bacterium]|jgi:hypothetical protein
MTPRTPLQQLGPVIEHLLAEPDPQRRERVLVQAVFEAGLASAVGIYAEGAPWMRLLGVGATAELPNASLVDSVAAGDIGPDLPPSGFVVVGGVAPNQRALALAGTCDYGDQENRDERADLLESLLMVLTCMDTGEGAQVDTTLPDRVLPPFQRQDSDERSACAKVAPDLRDLLSRIRAGQEELDRASDALDDERLTLSEVVDRDCQAAGDLLLDAFAERVGAMDAGEVVWPPSTPKARWLRLFEERAAQHASRFQEAGRTLSISAIDPGSFDIDVSTEAFLAILDGMLAVLEGHAAVAADAAPDLQMSFSSQRVGSRRDGRVGLQLCVERSRDPAGSPLRPRAEQAALPELRRLVREFAGQLRVDGATRLEVWLPFA